jgi:polysaccharide export outer membrane protein
MCAKNCNFTGIDNTSIVRHQIIFFAAGFLLFSCGSYKQNIMFKPSDGHQPEVFKKEAGSTERNYVIQKNDYLTLQIFSNNGERLIDPNPEMTGQASAGKDRQKEEPVNYLVDVNGIVKLPLVGEMRLEGITLRQAEEIVQKEYSKFFKDSFVIFSYVNKRVIVLGAPGGQVIPLLNQNVRVAEVLALAKGVSNDGRASNIKLIRGDHIYQIDFSTIKGFGEGNLLVEPGDIIYVEPIRRPFSEGLKDNYILGSLMISIITSFILLYNLKK